MSETIAPRSHEERIREIRLRVVQRITVEFGQTSARRDRVTYATFLDEGAMADEPERGVIEA